MDVDIDIGGNVSRDLRETVGAGVMVGGSEEGLTAETLHGPQNALVVGGYKPLIKAARHQASLVNMLNHGLPSQVRQCLAWKSYRLVARGYNSERFEHADCLSRENMELYDGKR